MKRTNIATDSQEIKDPPPGDPADWGNIFFTCDKEGCDFSIGSGTAPKSEDEGVVFGIVSIMDFKM
jgi:hypothetical protein